MGTVLFPLHLRVITCAAGKHCRLPANSWIEAISAKGGRHAMVVDVSQLTYEDMVHGLQYRNGLTSRSELSGLQIHNQPSGNNPTLINELRYLDGTLQLQAKTLLVAGINDATRKLMHKAKIDRDIALRDTLEEAIQEAQGPSSSSGHGDTGSASSLNYSSINSRSDS